MPATRADQISASRTERHDAVEPDTATTYDAPSVERVMTPEDLAREVHYAGTGSGDLEG
jgi:hypothetical protein